MVPQFNVVAIAGRLRGLIAGIDGGNLEAIAGRLRVDVTALRRALDLANPKLSAPVLTAVARYYHVDPVWLVYGADARDGSGIGIRARSTH